jgi:thiol-disulfide isomerase/thioredoxin
MSQKLLVCLLLVGVVGGSIAYFTLQITGVPMEGFEGSARAATPDNKPTPAPEFPENIPWVQSKPLKLANLHGQVVVVHFWTFGCINCIHNYPVYKAWQEKYAGKAVTIIGVHTPEFAREADADRVRAKAQENGLKFPIVIDNNSRIWKKWDNQFWPTIYLIDKKGLVRYHWDGELHPEKAADKQFAARIDELLAEKP